MIYFTADTHFWHFNIIGHSQRPVFPGVTAGKVPGWCSREEASIKMNELLIERWNSKITNNDIVYFLGDFAFCGKDKAIEILEQLNGEKHWILGNHDTQLAKKVGVFFEEVTDYMVLRVHDKNENEVQYHQPIVLMHYPILSWDGMHHKTWHLHGHSHGNLRGPQGYRLDVGVDTSNLYPYSYDDVKSIFKAREALAANVGLPLMQHVDHHVAKENNV